MRDIFFATDGSASAWATTREHELGFIGRVRFSVDVRHDGTIWHACLRFRDTRQQALEDARADAGKLVHMWEHDRVRLSDFD